MENGQFVKCDFNRHDTILDSRQVDSKQIILEET